MGLFTKDIKSMEDLFLHGLKDIYYAENQMVKSLPTTCEGSLPDNDLVSSGPPSFAGFCQAHRGIDAEPHPTKPRLSSLKVKTKPIEEGPGLPTAIGDPEAKPWVTPGKNILLPDCGRFQPLD